MTERCANCQRRMYTVDTWPAADYATGPFQSFDDRAFAAMHREWGWQSAWLPTLCRSCDTTHDHRQRPGARYRVARWVARQVAV